MQSQRWESNPQPPHYECGALPIEATLAYSPMAGGNADQGKKAFLPGCHSSAALPAASSRRPVSARFLSGTPSEKSERRGLRSGRSVLPWECGSGARRPHARIKSKTPPSNGKRVVWRRGPECLSAGSWEEHMACQVHGGPPKKCITPQASPKNAVFSEVERVSRDSRRSGDRCRNLRWPRPARPHFRRAPPKTGPKPGGGDPGRGQNACRRESPWPGIIPGDGVSRPALLEAGHPSCPAEPATT